MAYSDFTLGSALKTFELKLSEGIDLFANIPKLESSQLLGEMLRENLPLALGSNTEKARSELIIAPILLELRRQFHYQIGLFSGIDFTIDSERGLNGSCDFLISRSPELLIIRAPVMTIIEAKKENINGGLGQCVAEMVAARIFNEREENQTPVVGGAVTTGDRWKFLKLERQAIAIDLTEYLLSQLNQILGILASFLR